MQLRFEKVELIKGEARQIWFRNYWWSIIFKDQPFVKIDDYEGYVGSKFNFNSHSNSNQFGIKWNKKNLIVNLFGEYFSSDYKLPNGQYLFN